MLQRVGPNRAKLSPSQLVVIDPGVEDWRTLIAGLAVDAKLVVLDPRRDGVQAIADAIAGLGDLEAIHIVSHGRPGEIDLGAVRLSAASLDHYAGALARIGGALKHGGDILLYGCDVARGAAGRGFIEKLAAITGADAAAATHPVGASTLGGSWQLDVSIGAIAASSPFAARSLAAFGGLLNGGKGGDGGGGATGGDGGADSPDLAGGIGTTGTTDLTGGSGGGGGGAGVTGGAGGTGGDDTVDPGGTPGTGGAVAGAAGGTGGDAVGFDAGGGGGGGGAHGSVAAGLPVSGATGGAGGLGGNGAGAGGGGGGGAGGYGAVATAALVAATTAGAITGGTGGAGGASLGSGNGGNGGSGGIGLLVAAGGSLTIADAIAGGNGGAGGTSATGTAGTGGSGGDGVVGSNLVITMGSGSVTGGLSGDGSTQANALTFTGGANSLIFTSTTSGLSGGVGVSGSLTIDANGNTITLANQITGSGTLNVTNSTATAADVTLSNTSNAISTLGTVTLGKGAFSLTNTGVLAIAGAATAGGGYSVITDGGALTQNSGASIDTSAATSGGSGDGNITLKATGGFPFGFTLTLNANLNAGPTGNVNLAGDAGISQVAGTITAASIDANALAGTVSLISADNAFGTIIGNGTGGFTAVTSQTLTVGEGGVLSGLGAVNLTATGAASDLHVAFQSGNGGIAAHDSVTLAAGHDITIDESIEAPALTLNAPGQIAVNVALGDVTHPINIDVNAAGTASFNDVIAGSGTFLQEGAGTTTLAATNTYSGATAVIAGKLLVDGSIANSTTTVNGGTLGGHGTTGAVTVNSGGHLAPGNSAGILITGDLSMSSGSTFDEEIGGPDPGVTGYDQLQVHGTASLGGATLNLSLVNSFFVTGDATDNFTIIDNDGADTVTGTFAGLAEGATLTIGSGTFLITYHGGDGNDVVLLAANDVPSLSGLGDTAFYTENGAAVVLDTNGNASASDAELNQNEIFAGATLTLSRHSAPNPDDVFGGNGTGAGQLDLTHSNGLGENVSLDGGASFIGTFTQLGDGTFSITFNGSAFADGVAHVMQQITYANTSDNPPTSAQIDFTFSDGNGQPGGLPQGPGAAPGTATGSVTVQITQVDDAPVLINVALSAAYGIGTAGVTLSPAVGVFDVDGTPPSTLTGIAGATIKIASGFLATDQLFVHLATSGGHFITPDSEVTNISVQSNASGTLTLAGQDTFSHWQSVLDAVSYASSAADPTNGGSDAHRTITWVINDGALDSQTPNTDPDNLVNATLLHFDAPPALDLDASGAGTGFATTYTENDAPIRIVDTDVSISDADTAAMSSATVVVTNAKAGDSLSVAGALPGGIASFIDTSIAGKITLSLSNSATLADYQTALGQVRFGSSSENPDTADRDITVVVSDGEVDSNVAHATVHVIAVNDAPVVTGSVTFAPLDQSGSARLITQADLLSNVTDVDGPSLNAINLAIESGLGTLIDNHNGTWSYSPSANDLSTATFSYQVTDGVAAPLSDSATMAITSRFPDPVPLIPLVGTSGDDSFVAMTGFTSINGGRGNDTVTFNFKLVDAAISFFGNQVIVDGPGGISHTVLTGFETYVFTDGTVNNNDGNPLVDDLYYYSQYHDVWNAHVDADLHYNTFGWHESRNPDAFFSTVLYLSANPDVKAAGVNPLTNYDTVGWTLGRDPSILFDTNAYLKAYPDVAAAHVDPLAHFLQFGAQEGRVPFAPTSIIAANDFDYVYYLQHNPDVAAANADPLLHFELFGWKEGRNPNAYFDVSGYLANYPDVAAAGVNPLDHYHTFGWHEGRDPSTNFDTTDYLAQYPDVAAANIDPLKHFLYFGQAEGRQSFADGVWG